MIKIAALTLAMSLIFAGQSFSQTDKLTFPKGTDNPFAKYNKFLNTKFPSYELQGLDGQKRDLSIAAGKPVVINFWFTRCPPCVEEMPALNELKAKYGDKVDFVAVTFDDRQKVNSFLTKHPFTFDHYTDSKKLIDKLDIDTFPVSFFLDKSGTIKKILPGIPLFYGAAIDKLL